MTPSQPAGIQYIMTEMGRDWIIDGDSLHRLLKIWKHVALHRRHAAAPLPFLAAHWPFFVALLLFLAARWLFGIAHGPPAGTGVDPHSLRERPQQRRVTTPAPPSRSSSSVQALLSSEKQRNPKDEGKNQMHLFIAMKQRPNASGSRSGCR